MRKMWKKAAVLAATIALSCGAMSISSYADWQQNETGWWYQNEDNSYAQNEWKQINNKWYLFDEDGYIMTRWQNVNGTWYYMEPSGMMLKDWQNINEKWYYLNESGAMLTGWQNLNGNWYYMEPSGMMLTGWQNINETWYYLEASGAMHKGWQDGCYLSESGAMLKNQFAVIDGTEYHFDEHGYASNIAMSDEDADPGLFEDEEGGLGGPGEGYEFVEIAYLDALDMYDNLYPWAMSEDDIINSIREGYNDFTAQIVKEQMHAEGYFK